MKLSLHAIRNTSKFSSTLVENPLQIRLFMQNKPNVKDAQININSYMKSKYEKLDTWLSGKNKPNSNPIFTPLFRVLPAPLIRVLYTLKGYTLRGLVRRRRISEGPK
jgi:hypothetical protein